MIQTQMWTRALDWYFLSRSAPAVCGDLVVARCGHSVLGLARADGAVRWQLELEPNGGDENFFLPLGDAGWVTDVVRYPAKLTSVVAVARDGGELWRAELPVIGGARGGIIAGGRLLMPGKQGGGQRLLVFDDPATSGAFHDHALEWGASRLADGGRDQVVVANAMSRDQGNGLYRIGVDGKGATILAAPPAMDVAGEGGELVVAVLREASGNVATAVEVASGARRWSAPVSAQWVAVAGDRAITVEDRRPVCRALADGAVRWTGMALDGEVSSLAIGGSVLSLSHGRIRTMVAMADGALLGSIPSNIGPPLGSDDVIFAAGDRSVRAFRVS